MVAAGLFVVNAVVDVVAVCFNVICVTTVLGMRRLGSFLNPQLVRREKIAKELLQTEQSYVAALNTAVRVSAIFE